MCIRKVESLFPCDCLIIARLGFSMERTGHRTHLLRFFTRVARKYGINYIGIECANTKSSIFAKKLGFNSIDDENYSITANELKYYCSMKCFRNPTFSEHKCIF